MNISQAAKAAVLPTKTVRYYADIGLVEPEGRSLAGYRTYSDRQVRKLVFIRRAREFGFSIDECRELLGLYQDKERTSADVKRIASKKLAEIEAKQRELQLLREELAFVVSSCKGDDRPDCPIIDRLSLAGENTAHPK
ncbi:Cu(I)-responsive transcriptional regulator [Flexibacterium corallicola]|uniref:Cu(I)-responsive transcriptional regulator n=1 Tax=Flexibacterium corallicola TaxID=3037259 RepID=UPI00286F6240|nr:Cu(I)-responsive transcriptional regulator [Pseudovibrio sp. M1P-2-3]